jgi:hypothetical protein
MSEETNEKKQTADVFERGVFEVRVCGRRKGFHTRWKVVGWKGRRNTAFRRWREKVRNLSAKSG